MSLPIRRLVLLLVATLTVAPAFAQTAAAPPAQPFRGRSWNDLWRTREARATAAGHGENATIRRLTAPTGFHRDGGPLGTESYSPYFSGTDTSLGFPSDYSLFAGLKRESDCSLTELIGGLNQSTYKYEVQQSIPSFEKYLHTISGLTTTVDKFPNGCNDPILSGEMYKGIALGQIKNGNYAGASYSYTFDDAVYVGVFSASGSTYTNVSNSDYRVGYNVSGIVAADFNGDGYNDMAVLDTSDSGGASPQISILIANGDGTYKSPVQIPAGIAIFGIVTGDFNGDKKQDIVATVEKSTGDYELLFFAGKGDGTFLSPVATDTGTTERLVAQPDDVNGDNKLDIIAWDISSTAEPRVATLDALVNNGSASFTPTLSATAANYFPVYAEDINNDGKDDLIYTNTFNNTLVVLQGDGAGHFTYKATYPTVYFPDSGYVSDYDGDGHADLLVGVGGLYGAAPVNSGTGEILLGNGDFTFSTPASPQPIDSTVSFLGGAQSFAVADLNGDSKQDLAVVGATSGTGAHLAVTTFLNTGAANLANGTTVNFTLYSGSISGYGYVLAAPLSGTSPNSLIVTGVDTSTSSPAIQTAVNNGSGSFAVKSTLLDLPASVASMVSADFNGDSKGDLALLLNDVNTSSAGNALYTARGNGDGTFQAPVLLDSAVNLGGQVFTADVNGDGKPDLIVSQTTSGYSYVRVYLNQGSTFAAPVTFSTPDGATISWIIPADFNGDGKLDLGLIGYSTDPFDANLYIYTGNKTASFTYASTTALGSGGVESGVAIDMNHDGILDVVVDGCCGATGPVALLGKGGNAFYPPQSFVVPQSAYGVQAINLNGDAYPDLIFSLYNYTAAEIAPVINHYGKAPTVGKAATAITAPASTSGTQGQDVYIYVSVAETSAAGQPTGTVTLSYGSNVLQTATLGGGQVYFDLPTTGYQPGTYNFTLAYSGDNFNSPSSGATSVKLLYANATSLTVTPAAVAYDGTVTLTAKVTRPLGSGYPTGSVGFWYDSGNALLTTVPLKNGVASITTSVKGYPAGQYILQATYYGEATNPVDSGAFSPFVYTSIAPQGLAPTTTALVLSPNPITYGQTATLTATVTKASGSGVPTGNVSFSALFYGTTYNLGTVALNGSGQATVHAPTSSFGYYGNFSISAVYHGNSTTYASDAPTLDVYLRNTSYVYFTGNYTVTQGQPVTLTATVPQEGNTPPNGTLTFSADGVNLGTVQVVNSQAVLTRSTTGIAKGTYTVKATYNGDQYNGIGSATTTVTIQ